MLPVVNICWFRRDLRLHDNAALYHALKSEAPVLPLFIFDRNILDELKDEENDNKDRRVEFIHEALLALQDELSRHGSTAEILYGFPDKIFQELSTRYTIRRVFTNHDYEPYARERDAAIAQQLAASGIVMQTFKDHVIFEKNEVLKDDGKPYTVFTPYSRKWKALFNDFYAASYNVEKYLGNLYMQSRLPVPSLTDMGFVKTADASPFPGPEWRDDLLRSYNETRDIPSIPGTSRLSVHLRFGTISIRELARHASNLNQTFLGELIWRDFYQSILWHFPNVVGHSFRPEYDKIEFRNNEQEFDAWCEGRTGYPIVDAGMHELNETGFMHNRVRMITASFLVKHLLIDWRWGEAYFAKKLLDYELASNNGGWQWAAGSGCDAAPYFRIFNPYLQTKKFDPQFKYVRRWVPEVDSLDYPPPIVAHEFARSRCLATYSKALKK